MCTKCDSEPKRFCALAQNEHQFGQIGAAGDEEKGCVFFFFGSLFLFSSQQKRKSEQKNNVITLTVNNIFM